MLWSPGELALDGPARASRGCPDAPLARDKSVQPVGLDLSRLRLALAGPAAQPPANARPVRRAASARATYPQNLGYGPEEDDSPLIRREA